MWQPGLRRSSVGSGCHDSGRVVGYSQAIVSWRNIAISNNVGAVKHDVRTRLHALIEAVLAVLVATKLQGGDGHALVPPTMPV
jgi:hypothetical protein